MNVYLSSEISSITLVAPSSDARVFTSDSTDTPSFVEPSLMSQAGDAETSRGSATASRTDDGPSTGITR